MTHLKEGMKAPHFEGKNQNGESVSLNQFKGKKVVLYFYPKDNTPGCTAEACNLNDNYDRFVKQGYEVIGVSPDSESSHQKFIDKYGLQFNLISDTERKILEDYGAWGNKKLYGKTFLGVKRMTFIIDEEGVIEKVIEKVKTKEHASQILNL